MPPAEANAINRILTQETAKLDTINDMDIAQQSGYLSDFIKSNKVILKKYFGIFDLMVIKHSSFAKIFSNYSIVALEDSKSVESSYRFSKKQIKIPKNLEIVAELLIKGDLETKGIFRINTTNEKIDSLIKVIDDIVSGSISREEGEKLIKERFDIIDLSEAYKTLFKVTPNPVIPQKFQKFAIKIDDIEDGQEKLICTKAFVYSLPPSNRMILESCAFICKVIASRLEMIQSKEKMNINGLGIVMMPNIVRPDTNKENYTGIKKLSTFISYLFSNFEEIIRN